MTDQTTTARVNLKATLSRKLAGAGKIAVLAVGSSLRSDDGAAMWTARCLRQFRWPSRPKVKVFLGETAPENLTGEIRKYQPTHLVIVDAAQTGRPAGRIAIIDLEWEDSGMTFSTHNLPLAVTLRYLQNCQSCCMFIVGIEPKSLEFCGAMSAVVQRAATRLATTIHAAVMHVAKGSLSDATVRKGRRSSCQKKSSSRRS